MARKPGLLCPQNSATSASNPATSGSGGLTQRIPANQEAPATGSGSSDNGSMAWVLSSPMTSGDDKDKPGSSYGGIREWGCENSVNVISRCSL
ncbi:unnamed protein product [Cuscuta campestris]|uniref:Uncharacterized protein n=1 Tax=Cuscuta campestris TaxID=132261 RepID=A0A484MB90_9ASTE|nr:unnamed protein product [Cuscuta campestris]